MGKTEKESEKIEGKVQKRKEEKGETCLEKCQQLKPQNSAIAGRQTLAND